jgi:phenylpyruvate tautomerase PptA (4-oxalocrotonate tautomerase family)
MEFKCRLTHNLAEIKVDEIETTLFKSHPKEIDDMITNLLDIVEDLAKLKDQTISVVFHEVD